VKSGPEEGTALLPFLHGPLADAEHGLGDAPLVADFGDLGRGVEGEAARGLGLAAADSLHLADTLEEFPEKFFFHGRDQDYANGREISSFGNDATMRNPWTPGA